MTPMTFRFTTNKGKLPANVYTRGGTKSPELITFQYRGKWRVPYEQRKLGIELTMAGVLQLLYRNVDWSFMCSKNPLLELMPKEECNWKYYPIPIFK